MNRATWVLSVSLFVWFAGCAPDPLRECHELLGAEDFEAAVTTCEGSFEQTANPQAAEAVAEAYSGLGNHGAVLAWHEGLAASSRTPRLWGLVARAHLLQGEDDLAAEAYAQALSLAQKRGDQQTAAKSSYGLFYLAWKHSDFHPALVHANDAVDAARKAEDRETEAKALRGILALRYDLGDLEGAWHTLRAARDLVGAEEHSARARLLVYEGTFRLAEGRNALGRDALERALESATGEEEASFFRSIHLNLVDANLELGDLERAEHHLEEAWSHADPAGGNRSALLLGQARLEQRRGEYAQASSTLETALGENPIPDWAWRLLHLRGQVEQARGASLAAAEAFEDAVQAVEGMRAGLGFDEFKSWLIDSKREPYESLFLLEVEAADSLAALATVERAKVRTFFDAFIQATATREPSPSPAVAAERLEALRELLPEMSRSPMASLRPLPGVLAALKGRHVLVYFEARDALWLVTVRAGQPTIQKLVGSNAEIKTLVSRMLAEPSHLEATEELGRRLLPPEALPAAGSRLYVVADGVLGEIPFAALRTDGRYLVESFDLLYVPGLNALAAIEGQPWEAVGAPVVLGDPQNNLPEARNEAREVAAALGVSPRLGADASAQGLGSASRAPLLHMATHSGLGPRGPWLALAGGEVRAGGILQVGLAPRLVVLASCVGGARRGRGMWGSLAAAFLGAGSRAVFASLWSIDDGDTRRFVRQFYAEGGATDPAGALGRTQRIFLAAGEPANVWAPFVLFGSPGG